MAETVELAIINVQSKAISAGCHAAPDNAAEAAGALPFSNAYELEGELAVRSQGFAEELGVIRVDMFVGRGVLPKAIAAAAAMRDPFLRSIRDDITLGGKVDTVRYIKWKFGVLKYGDVEYIGYQFDIGIKLTLSTS